MHFSSSPSTCVNSFGKQLVTVFTAEDGLLRACTCCANRGLAITFFDEEARSDATSVHRHLLSARLPARAWQDLGSLTMLMKHCSFFSCEWLVTYYPVTIFMYLFIYLKYTPLFRTSSRHKKQCAQKLSGLVNALNAEDPLPHRWTVIFWYVVQLCPEFSVYPLSVYHPKRKLA